MLSSLPPHTHTRPACADSFKVRAVVVCVVLSLLVALAVAAWGCVRKEAEAEDASTAVKGALAQPHPGRVKRGVGDPGRVKGGVGED